VLTFDPDRPPVEARPAATILLLRDRRDAEGGGPRVGGLEVLVMQRSLQSSFMGGAVVFPGGRVERDDADAAWNDEVASTKRATGAWWDDAGKAARIAACRESLEEVGVVPLVGPPVDADELAVLRAAVARGGSSALREALASRGRALDLAGLVPYARWVTPLAEAKRFDARFFLAHAPAAQVEKSDDREAIRVRWSPPAELLRGFDEGAITLFPPTHRTLERLAEAANVAAAFRAAERASLEVICPRFVVDGGVPVLALPGDPLHEVRERRIDGGSRFVLRGERWLPENA
jgi:8-oxo-dGTP pyrophosphatase MutT (NUDIX family)